MCLDASEVVLSLNLHVEMVKTLVNGWIPNISQFSTFTEVLLPALRGEHIFEKKTPQNKSQPKYCTSVPLK